MSTQTPLVSLKPPSRPPPTLATLPKETLSLICSFIPIASAVDMSTVCRGFQVAAEKHIWRKLWLAEPKAFGVPAQVLHSSRQRDERRERYRKAAKDRILLIMKALLRDERRMTYVREVDATTYRYTSLAIAQILYYVREHITTLHLADAHRHIENELWIPHECIHAKLADFDGIFKQLEHITLGVSRNCSYQNLLRTISLAPNIQSLEISARDHLIDDEPPARTNESPLEYEVPALLYATEMKLDFADNDGLPEVCTDLIKKAPNLQKVTVSDIWQDLEEDGWSDEEKGQSDSQFAHLQPLSVHPRLEYLDWRCGSGYIFSKRLKEGDGFHALKILIVDAEVLCEEEENIEYLTLPPLRSLEKLVIRVRHHHTPTQIHDNEHKVSKTDSPVPEWPISTKVVDQLSAAPKLHTILFTRDEDLRTTLEARPSTWEALGVRGVVIRTFTNGLDDLVHLQILTRSRPNPEFDSSSGDTGKDDEHDDDRYVVKDTLQWSQACAFNGRRVPVDQLNTLLSTVEHVWDWKGDAERGIFLPLAVWDALRKWEREQETSPGEK